MLLNAVQTVWHVFFPPDIHQRRVQNLHADTFCEQYYCPQSTSRHTHLLSYADPAVASCIYAAKFRGNQTAQKILATALAMYLQQARTPVVLVPIPLSRRRYRKRGYNQIIEIAKRLDQPGQTHIIEALYRNTHTKPQTTLQRAERLENMKGVFSVQKNKLAAIPTNATVYIIDDVTTTGATLTEAHRALRDHVANTITCVALAH